MTVVTLLRPKIACDESLKVAGTWNDADDYFFLRIHVDSRASQAAVQFAAVVVRLDRSSDRRGTVKLAVNLYDCENCSVSSQPYVTALWFYGWRLNPNDVDEKQRCRQSINTHSQYFV